MKFNCKEKVSRCRSMEVKLEQMSGKESSEVEKGGTLSLPTSPAKMPVTFEMPVLMETHDELSTSAEMKELSGKEQEKEINTETLKQKPEINASEHEKELLVETLNMMKDRTAKEVRDLNAKREAELKNLKLANWISLEQKLREEDENIMGHRRELLVEERGVIRAKFFDDASLSAKETELTTKVIKYTNYERARRNRKDGLMKAAQSTLRRSQEECNQRYQKMIAFEENNLAVAVAKYEEMSTTKETMGCSSTMAMSLEASTSTEFEGGGWMLDDDSSVNTEK